jgi:hypothetical protein
MCGYQKTSSKRSNQKFQRHEYNIMYICEFFFSMLKGKKFKASLPTSNAYFSIALKYYNRL